MMNEFPTAWVCDGMNQRKSFKQDMAKKAIGHYFFMDSKYVSKFGYVESSIGDHLNITEYKSSRIIWNCNKNEGYEEYQEHSHLLLDFEEVETAIFIDFKKIKRYGLITDKIKDDIYLQFLALPCTIPRKSFDLEFHILKREIFNDKSK